MKHFEATRHQSVASVKKAPGVFAKGVFAEGVFAEGSLVIRLSEDEQTSFGQETIEAPDLAQEVYVYWRANVPHS